MTSPVKVKMYTLEFCPTCIKARRVLAERGIEFDDIIVDDNDELCNEVIAVSGQVTVPVIIWPDGRVEVGIDGEMG